MCLKSQPGNLLVKLGPGLAWNIPEQPQQSLSDAALKLGWRRVATMANGNVAAGGRRHEAEAMCSYRALALAERSILVGG